MNILSLFDGAGISKYCFEQAGLPVASYYTSEIDKFAIQVARKNNPEMIELGDIRNIKAENLAQIDFVIGGSPCQGFSFAGKQLNFEDERSKLFFEFVRLVKECRPKYFLLENVKMKKEYQDVISGLLGVRPVEINSALVSAQNRKRLYWTNIEGISQPKDKYILLKDIISKGFTEKQKAYCLDANYYKGTSPQAYQEKSRRQLIQIGVAGTRGNESINRVYSTSGKAPTLSTCQGGHREPKIAVNDFIWRKLTPLECERLQTWPEGYTEGVSNSQRYKMLGNGFTAEVVIHILSYLLF